MSDHFVPTSLAAQRFGRYPAYRDSGVQWPGEIPAHWEIRRLKSTVVKCQNGVWGGEPDGEHDIACIRVADFNRRTHTVEVSEPTLRSVDPRVASAHRLREGDLLLEKSGGGERQPVGAVVLFATDLRAVCSNFIARMSVQDSCDSQFLVYLHAALYSSRINVRSIKQSIGIQNLDGEAYLNESVGIPALAEQSAIAAFLDRETAQTNALIAKQRELISLLQEKRIALISHAVTKGLDPDVAMKDSGVEWLREIPAHWKMKRVKWVARMESGHTPDKKVDAYWNDGEIPWVSLQDTGRLKNQDYISDTGSYTNELGLRNSSARLLPPRSVIFSRDATIGLCAITDRSMAVSQHFIAWICSETVLPEYLLRVFDTMQEELVRLTMGATLRTIGMPDVKTLTTPIPTVLEQHQIVAFVQKETAAIDALIAKVGQAIDRLTEYRTALISAAVTGKIDVRSDHGSEAAANTGSTEEAP